MADELDIATKLLSSALDRYNLQGEHTKCVLRGFSLVISYETEIRYSKALFSRLRNFAKSSDTRSIGSLPAEVLVRIFRLVCHAHPCPRSVAAYFDRAPPLSKTELIVLSRVCSRWRQLMIGSAELWSHIDLVPNQFQVATPTERANTYTTRAAETPLDVHIVDAVRDITYNMEVMMPLSPDSKFLDFLTSITPRIQSLSLRSHHAPARSHFCQHVLFIFFTQCVPGRVTRLSLSVARDYDTLGDDIDQTLIWPPKETVEALWYPITVLRLRNFYPEWASKLYRSFVELCLSSESLEVSIPEFCLIAILKSSPGLRVFKFGLEITHTTPNYVPIEPVALVDLEQLNLGSMKDKKLGYFLRLIAPSTKPLTLAIHYSWETHNTPWRPRAQFTSRAEVERFFTCSNVTKLYAHGFDGYSQLSDMLSMVLSVRVLVLDVFKCNQVPEESVLPQDFTLDELYWNNFKWGATLRIIGHVTGRHPKYSSDINITEELNTATNLLKSALNRCFKACSNLKIRHPLGARIEIRPELADRILQELTLISSYEAEIQQSKAIISRLHNFNWSQNMRSISSLPTEVLARIFRMVCNMSPCPQFATYVQPTPHKPSELITNPIILSHVCYHWRDIVINLVDLWSYVDLVTNEFRIPGYLERPNMYLARSGQTLLDIHIHQVSKSKDREETRFIPETDHNSLEFMIAIAPRGTLCHLVLSTSFANCVPGQLVHLDLGVPKEIHVLPRNDIDTTLVGLLLETVEAAWHPVRFLRLDKFYPVWTSKLYRGLIDLRLDGDDIIPESKLITILKSSPRLRILKIHLRITHLSPKEARIRPVPLVDLEQLSALPVGEPQLGYVLRLIAPGSKPLGLTIVNPWLGSTMERLIKFTSRPETRRFLARAKVTRLYASSFKTYKQLEYVLNMMPSVRVLVLDGCRCLRVSEESVLPSDFALDEPYVIRSTKFAAVSWPSIERMVEKHRVRKLTLWWYDHCYNGLGESGVAVEPDNLRTVFPVVKVIPREDPNPVEEWN